MEFSKKLRAGITSRSLTNGCKICKKKIKKNYWFYGSFILKSIFSVQLTMPGCSKKIYTVRRVFLMLNKKKTSKIKLLHVLSPFLAPSRAKTRDRVCTFRCITVLKLIALLHDDHCDIISPAFWLIPFKTSLSLSRSNPRRVFA